MSAILQTFNMMPKEGKLEEAMAEVARAKAIYEARGASSVRLFGPSMLVRRRAFPCSPLSTRMLPRGPQS